MFGNEFFVYVSFISLAPSRASDYSQMCCSWVFDGALLTSAIGADRPRSMLIRKWFPPD